VSGGSSTNLTGVIISSGGVTTINSVNQYGTGALFCTPPAGGTIGQVLTSGNGAAAALTWTSPALLPSGDATTLLTYNWASPGTIGSTTPSTLAATKFTLTGAGGSTTIQNMGGTGPYYIQNATTGFGQVRIRPSTTGTTTWFYPATDGASGDVLLSAAGIAEMTWNTPTGTGAVVKANTPTLITPVLGAATGTSLAVTGAISSSASTVTGTQLISTVSIGTAPLTVTSTTNVANLNASSLSGATFANPGAIGATPSTGQFTSLRSTGTGQCFIKNCGIAGPGWLTFQNTTTSTGQVTIIPATTGNWNFVLPAATGTSGQVLTSAGTNAEMTWTTPVTGTVTSVAMSVPAFLSIAGSPITTTGTLAVTLSGTALPVLNGGTGTTTSTGTGNVVLSSTPTLTTPVLGAATGTSLVVSGAITTSAGAISASAGTVTGTQLISTIAIGTAPLTVTSTTNVTNLNASTLSGATFAAPGAIGGTTASTGKFTSVNITGTASTVISNCGISGPGYVTLQNTTTSTGQVTIIPANTGNWNFNFPISAGTANQVLLSQAGGTTAMTWGTISSLYKYPTQQNLPAGTTSYTLPSPTPLYLLIEIWAGGGGGAGCNGGSCVNGTAGQQSSFSQSSVFTTVTGGGYGSKDTGGIAGTSTLQNLGSNFFYVSGVNGGAPYNASGGGYGGGSGGSSFGGLGGQNYDFIVLGTGGAGQLGGGGGGGGTVNVIQAASGGGGGGAYIKFQINNPSGSYTCAVGTGGTGGVGSVTTGGAGGSGYIIVHEYYQ